MEIVCGSVTDFISDLSVIYLVPIPSENEYRGSLGLLEKKFTLEDRNIFEKGQSVVEPLVSLAAANR